MDVAESYAFDVTGYLLIPGVLDAAAIRACNRALDAVGKNDGLLGWQSPWREPFRELLVHPILVEYLNALCGAGFRLEREPVLLGAHEVRPELSGGAVPRDPARAYYQQNAHRSSQAVEVIWALEDIDPKHGGPILIPASHKSNLELPESLRDPDFAADLVHRPRLRAGDLLLCAGALARGFAPWRRRARRLLAYGYGGRASIQSRGTGPATAEPLPRWMDDLSPVERALLAPPGHRETTPPRAVVSDGQHCWVDEGGEPNHPSALCPNPDAGIDAAEFYRWDLQGYLVVADLLSRDQLKRANAAVDRFQDRARILGGLAKGFPGLGGTGRPTLEGPLNFPEHHNQPFFEMIAHPKVIQRLNWMMGPGFRVGGVGILLGDRGCSGHFLHDAGEPLDPSRSSVFHNGRSYSTTVVVQFALRDRREGDGGFVCVPGSHKARYTAPLDLRGGEDPRGLLAEPPMRAGSAVFFADGGLTHGARPWRSRKQRRVTNVRYHSSSFNWWKGPVEPGERWGSLIDGMTDEQLAVMRGPERDLGNSNEPRLEVSNGKARVAKPSVRREG